MAFLKRLGYYLVGLSIGIVFLTFFLKNKSEETGTEFCYFPNCRTLKNIRSKPLAYSDAIKSMMDEGRLDSLDISRFLNEGDVDFGSSDTDSKPCKTYVVKESLNGKDAAMKISNCSEEAVLEEIVME